MALFGSRSTYKCKKITFECTSEFLATIVDELTLTLHQPIFEGTFILMTLGPAVGAEPFHFVKLEVALVAGAVSKHSESMPVSLIVQPVAFILC